MRHSDSEKGTAFYVLCVSILHLTMNFIMCLSSLLCSVQNHHALNQVWGNFLSLITKPVIALVAKVNIIKSFIGFNLAKTRKQSLGIVGRSTRRIMQL